MVKVLLKRTSCFGRGGLILNKAFSGDLDFLSNMYNCPMIVNRVSYSCLEAAFQSFKEVDKIKRVKFAKMNGYQAKAYWKNNPDWVRSDWMAIRLEVMRRLLYIKFSDLDLIMRLLSTGEMELVETNFWHDGYWGVCSCPRCGNKGHNNLGKLLMEVRDFYRNPIAQTGADEIRTPKDSLVHTRI